MRQLYISAAFVCFHLSSRSARSVLKINRLVTRIFISHISSTLGFVAPYLAAGNNLINIIEFFFCGKPDIGHSGYGMASARRTSMPPVVFWNQLGDTARAVAG